MRKLHLFRFFPAFLVVYEFAANLSNDMYVPALPDIAEGFGVTYNVVTWTMTAWLVGSSSIELVVGPLSDRHGRRPVLFVGGVLFLLASVACALAPNLWMLVLARFFQGLGVCGLMVAGYAAIHEWYEDKRAVPLLGWMGSAAIVAPMLGPIIGAEVLMFVEWRMIFWIIMGLAALGLAGLWITMPESNIAPDRHALKPRRFIVVYWRIAKNLHFMLSALAVGLGYAGIFVWISASPFVLIQLLGASREHYGLLQIPIFGSYFIGAKAIKYVLPRWIRKTEIMWGLVIAALSSIAMVIASLYVEEDLTLILPMCGYAFGLGMAVAPMTRRTLIATGERRGAAVAVFYFYTMISGALGTLAVTLFYNNTLVSVAIILTCLILLSLVVEIIACSKLVRNA